MKQATHFTVFSGWKVLLQDMGLNAEHILALAQLPGDLFSRKDATVSVEQYFGLWQAIETVAGRDEMPLLLGQSISVEAFSPPIFAGLCSPNLQVALQRLSTFKKLIGPMKLMVDIQPGHTSLSMECLSATVPIPRSLALTELVFFTQLGRIGTRHRIEPLEIVTPVFPDDSAPYEAFFGRPIKQGTVTCVRFSTEDAVRPFLTASEAMWSCLEPDLRKRLSDLDTDASMSQRVRAALLEGLPAGQFSIQAVANNLAISKRTLQRQLSEESSSFSGILNATREELARHYLRSQPISNGEIAFLLGFEEVNSFLRAFKDWTGTTPRSFRQAPVTQLN